MKKSQPKKPWWIPQTLYNWALSRTPKPKGPEWIDLGEDLPKEDPRRGLPLSQRLARARRTT